MILRKISALLPALVIAALALSGCGRSGDLSFPKQAENKVILKPGGAELVRFADNKPDGSSQVRIEYADNRTAFSSYRADKTLAEVTILYPAPKGSSKRQLQRHAVFDKDGKTLISNVEYYADGKLAKQGTNFGGSTIFESYSFAADGVTVARHQRFVKKDKWLPVFDESYAANGVVTSSLALQTDGSVEITTFTDKGVKASLSKAPADGITITTSYFYPDGINIYKVVEQGSSSTKVTLKRFDGTNIVVREMSESSLSVDYFTEKGETFYRQSFTVNKVQTSDGGTLKQFRLNYASELDTKGNILRQVYMQDDGTTPKTVTINHQPAGSGHLDKTFALDGTLAKVEVYDAKSKLIATTIHTSSENIRETLPARLTTLEKFERPPAPTGKYPSYAGFDF